MKSNNKQVKQTITNKTTKNHTNKFTTLLTSITLANTLTAQNKVKHNNKVTNK